MTDEMHIPTEELARWLDKKYSRHGEIEDGLGAERLRALSAENKRLRAVVDAVKEWQRNGFTHEYSDKVIDAMVAVKDKP